MDGIIYKVQAYQESSKLLFVYTGCGKKTLLARNSQKINDKTRILAQYLTKISFDDNQKSFQTLKDGKILNDYQNIKNEFSLTKDAALILEIIDRLVVDDYDHDWIYNEASLALEAKNIKEASFSFAIKILKILGYDLNLKGNGKKIKGVNIESGGLVYAGDSLVSNLDTHDAIYLLKLSLIPYNDLEKIDDDIIKNINFFIKDYYLYHMEIKLNSLN